VPKSDPDHELQRAAQLAIRRHRSLEEAARAVGLSPSTLWRVARSGKAIPRTRVAVETWRSRLELNEINEMAAVAELPMSRDELLQTRRTLVTMLQFLNRCIDSPFGAAATTNKAWNE
jgi:transposase-like protein